MRSFACTSCGQLLFFENSRCLRCDSAFGLVPEQLELTTAEPAHIRDTLQTTAHFGLRVAPRAGAVPPSRCELGTRASEDFAERDIAALVAEWLPLSYALNAANRSMGKEDESPVASVVRHSVARGTMAFAFTSNTGAKTLVAV